MTDRHAHATAVLDDAAVEDLKADLRGELLWPADAGYEAARRVWNAMIDRRPAAIVRCTGAADVISALGFARRAGLPVAVRGGGHNVAGNAVCDGGLVMDLTRMKGIRVDPARRSARAEPGLTWGEFDRETQAFGLATTGGVISSTGIAGLTLGGGVGWLVRKHGLACDNLLSADVVTADGRLLTASSTENQDLFWGVRGGGGNLGIVTSLEYRLHLLGPVMGGMILYPRAQAREVLRFHRDFVQTAPEELTAYAGMLTSPEGVPVIAIFLCYSGPLGAGEKALKPVRAFGRPMADLVRPMAYREMQTMLDAGFPPGLQNYWKSNFLTELSDEAIDVLVAHAETTPSPQSAVLLEYYGGAASRVGEDGTAFPHRRAHYNLVIVSIWSDPGEAETHVRWARDTWEAMQPFSSGRVYVNLLGEAEGEERVRAAFGGNYNRLVALKNRYDPTNVFRVNQNIKPTT